MMTTVAATDVKVTLYGTPRSNYSARCKYIANRKGLSEELFACVSPAELGGLKSEEYLKLNPLGKMPIAVLEKDGKKDTLFESSVICEYLAEKYASFEPSFLPTNPESRAKARLIAQLVDIYIGAYHFYMYKPTEEDRAAKIELMKQGFDAVEHALDENGPYAIGKELSIADACMWANWAFYDFMLPTFFGWNPTDGRPKLKKWKESMIQESQITRDAYLEVFNALYGWWDGGRWDKLSMKPLTPRTSALFPLNRPPIIIDT